MKQAALLLCCCLVGITTTRAADLVRIKAVKKTADTRTSAAQRLPTGQSQAKIKDQYYEISLQALSTDVPNDVFAEWIVLVEKWGGGLTVRSSGREAVDLVFGRPVGLETTSFRLRSREWTSGPRPGTLAESIAGFGIRVVTTAGDVIAEKYSPSSAEKDIRWEEIQRLQQPPLPQDTEKHLPRRRRRRLQ